MTRAPEQAHAAPATTVTRLCSSSGPLTAPSPAAQERRRPQSLRASRWCSKAAASSRACSGARCLRSAKQVGAGGVRAEREARGRSNARELGCPLACAVDMLPLRLGRRRASSSRRSRRQGRQAALPSGDGALQGGRVGECRQPCMLSCSPGTHTPAVVTHTRRRISRLHAGLRLDSHAHTRYQETHCGSDTKHDRPLVK
jgi:hypothetical protein